MARYLTLAVLALLAFALPARAQEQRCNDLGSECACSEQLDTDTYNQVDSGPNQDFDPVDSNTTKECRGAINGGIFLYVQDASAPFVDGEPETGMPPGNDVDFVLRNGLSYGSPNLTGLANSGTIASTVRKVCYRYYTRPDPDYDGPADSCAFGKAGAMTFNNGKQLIWTDHGCFVNPLCEMRLATGGFVWTGSPYLPVDSQVPYDSYSGVWSRWEMCLACDWSAGGTGTDCFASGQIKRLSDGHLATYGPTNVGPRGANSNGLTGWLYESYREANTGCTFNYTPFKDVSHIMEAHFTTDTGQFIGAAVEVEGGAAPDTDPPVVQTVTPSDGAINVPVAQNVVLSFSEGLDAATVTTTNVKLLDGVTPVPAAVTYNASNFQVTINPNADLATDHAYDVKVESEVQDDASPPNPMAADFGASFTTVAAAAGAIAFTSATFSKAEGTGGTTNLDVTLERTSGSEGGVNVTVSLSNGTATGGAALTAGVDFVNTSHFVEWANQQGGIKTIQIPINPDAVDEGSQTFTLTIGSPNGGVIVITPSTATATILDDDATVPTVTLTVSPATIDEDGGQATLTATLSSALSEPLTVAIDWNGDGAGEAQWYQTPIADFGADAPRFEFAAGQTVHSFNVYAFDDSVADDGEVIRVTLLDPFPAIATLAGGSQEVTITIDEGTVPTVTLSRNNATFSETGGSVEVTATLSATSAEDTIVTLGGGGTATVGDDYDLAGVQIGITAGNLSGSLVFTAVHDTRDEPDETIIKAIDATTANVTENGEQTVTSTILDDDDPPTVSFVLNDDTIDEAGGVSTATFTLSAISGRDVEVFLAYTGTAGHVSDYIRSTESVVIPALFGNRTAKVTAVHDLVDDDAETVTVAIDSVTNGTEDGVQADTITITDDDLLTIHLGCDAAINASATRGRGAQWFGLMQRLWWFCY